MGAVDGGNGGEGGEGRVVGVGARGGGEGGGGGLEGRVNRRKNDELSFRKKHRFVEGLYLYAQILWVAYI